MIVASRPVTTWSLTSCAVFLYVLSFAFSGVPTLSRSSLAFCVVLLVVLFLRAATTGLRIGNWVFYPLAFLAMSFLLLAYAPSMPVEHFLSILVAWVGAICIGVAVNNGTPVSAVLWALTTASALNAVAVIAGFDSFRLYGNIDNIDPFARGRASGLVGNSNILAILSFLPLVGMLVWRESSRPAMWMLGLPSAALALVATGSQKAVLLLAIIVLVVVFRSLKSVRVAGYLTASLAVTLGVSALVISTYDMFNALRGIYSVERLFRIFEGENNSANIRLELIEIGMQLIAQRPLFGFGLDEFRQLNSWGFYSHNTAIELAVSGGLGFLVVYYAMYAVIVRASLKWKRKVDVEFPQRWLLLAFVLIVLEMTMVTFDTKIHPALLVLLLAKSCAGVSVSRGKAELLNSHRQSQSVLA